MSSCHDASRYGSIWTLRCAASTAAVGTVTAQLELREAGGGLGCGQAIAVTDGDNPLCRSVARQHVAGIEREGRTQSSRLTGAVSGVVARQRFAHVAVEVLKVGDRHGPGGQHVRLTSPSQQRVRVPGQERLEMATQARDRDVQVVQSSGFRQVSPQGIDEHVTVHRPPGVDSQDAQHRERHRSHSRQVRRATLRVHGEVAQAGHPQAAASPLAEVASRGGPCDGFGAGGSIRVGPRRARRLGLHAVASPCPRAAPEPAFRRGARRRGEELALLGRASDGEGGVGESERAWGVGGTSEGSR